MAWTWEPTWTWSKQRLQGCSRSPITPSEGCGFYFTAALNRHARTVAAPALITGMSGTSALLPNLLTAYFLPDQG